ncbi:hypothetical protein ACFL9T_21580, partial [Thermodesulfobacteriota bacterium]
MSFFIAAERTAMKNHSAAEAALRDHRRKAQDPEQLAYSAFLPIGVNLRSQIVTSSPKGSNLYPVKYDLSLF